MLKHVMKDDQGGREEGEGEGGRERGRKQLTCV